MTTQKKLTPMLAQYLSIKKEYPDALLFFRMGDFYELFFEDAEVASKELQIALTSRNPNDKDPVPMCGVPYHAVSEYLKVLLEKNYKVAICEQIEDPKKARGLVKRAVTRVLTPGTVVEENSLSAKTNNFLASIYINKTNSLCAATWLDYSTGEWLGFYSKEVKEVWKWISKVNPAEILCYEGCKIPDEFSHLKTKVTYLPKMMFDFKRARSLIDEYQMAENLMLPQIEAKKELIQACGGIILYLTRTHNEKFSHIRPIKIVNLDNFLIIDELSERNLELFQTLDGSKGAGTLIHLLDETKTPMGGRFLYNRLKYPHRDVKKINNDLEVVSFFISHEDILEEIGKALKGINDLERLINRIFLNRASPRDFYWLKNSLKELPKIITPLKKIEGLPDKLLKIKSRWNNLDELFKLLDKSIKDNPPTTISEGGIFKMGYNSTLDELIEYAEHGEAKLKELLKKEQENTSIPKLKLGFNRVFGYYFEVSKTHIQKVPEYFIRRQTLVNCERYITEELKDLEDKILRSEEKRKKLEYELFLELRDKVIEFKEEVLSTSSLIALLDFYSSMALCAKKYSWHKPHVVNGLPIKIKDGRHPVVEYFIGKNNYIPNDIEIDENSKILLITGPNMAGKSTVLREVAIICILAQMGSYVPAKEAIIGICDRIFTRVGASDKLALGQSTFMVEMMETARILRQATKKSLVILDEIGRGTSTFDGLSLAWAVVETLAQKFGGIRTLFATHYHELTDLETKIKGIKNLNIAVTEYKGEIVFLRKLLPGPSDKSYGIEVAKLAGVPRPVIKRAKEILKMLEQKMMKIKGKSDKRTYSLLLMDALKNKSENLRKKERPSHPLVLELRKLNLDQISPKQALDLLYLWKEKWCEEKIQ